MKKYFLLISFFISTLTYSQTENKDYTSWKKYGVKKVEMALPNTRDKWEEILIFNPGTQFSIQNEKDLYIENLDLLSLIVGSDKIGFYKAIRFINGTNISTTEQYTKRYSGRLELLDNNGISSMSGEAVIDFFYYPNNNKLGIVLIANKIGMTKTRLWVTDTPGFRILN